MWVQGQYLFPSTYKTYLNYIKQEAVRPTLDFLVAKSLRKVSLLAS